MEQLFDGNWLLLLNLIIEGGIIRIGYKLYTAYKDKEEAKAKERQEHAKAINEAMLSLLRNKLRGICLKAEERGFIYIYETEDINYMLPAYKKLGGNGTTKQMCESALDLPHKRKE